jgi:hypothetical protein
LGVGRGAVHGEGISPEAKKQRARKTTKGKGKATKVPLKAELAAENMRLKEMLAAQMEK